MKVPNVYLAHRAHVYYQCSKDAALVFNNTILEGCREIYSWGVFPSASPMKILLMGYKNDS